MKRYRVEFRSEENHFITDCIERRFRIYVDGKLRLVTGDKLVAMNNFEKFTREYGLGRVEIKEREFNELSKVELQDLKENIKRIVNDE
jgi:hypothetical protein